MSEGGRYAGACGRSGREKLIRTPISKSELSIPIHSTRKRPEGDLTAVGWVSCEAAEEQIKSSRA